MATDLWQDIYHQDDTNEDKSANNIVDKNIDVRGNNKFEAKTDVETIASRQGIAANQRQLFINRRADTPVSAASQWTKVPTATQPSLSLGYLHFFNYSIHWSRLY